MEKFDQVERWALGVALENLRKGWKKENAEALLKDGRPLFTDGYVDSIVDRVISKVDKVTLKKALKNLAEQEKNN